WPIIVEVHTHDRILQDLTKYHGATCAVKKTTYGVQTEDCFGLVGASGAGKTTTFDVITGLRFANNGRVFIGNQFVNRTQGIGYCPQFDALLPRLTCEQNMMVIAALIVVLEIHALSSAHFIGTLNQIMPRMRKAKLLLSNRMKFMQS
ncbi:hypothetical protein ANCDUO_26031, partial [Ancylostoma duodenale]